VLVLEQADQVGASWRERYDHLHLNTVRRLSHLPGLGIPRRYGRWPSKDNFVDYLETYQRHFSVPIQPKTTVERVEPANGSWSLKTSGGTFTAKSVVVATGYMREPVVPDWPGRGNYSGELIHSVAYRNPGPHKGRDVLVVGTGNSGADIALDLAQHGAGRIWSAVRSGPNIVKAETLGLPYSLTTLLAEPLPGRLIDTLGRIIQRLSVGDLSRYGIPAPQVGAHTSIVRDIHVPIVDFGFVGQIKRRRIQVVPAVEALDKDEVVLAGGARFQPDAVIAATGYRPALDPLVGHPGVLLSNGRPTVHGAECHALAPELYFIGFRDSFGGQLREIGRQAKALASRIAARKAH
jgi:putative flavoprotein involved in K+ transport